MPNSLTEVLEAGRWEKALFTTYSLSLTFFESIILRALRKVECREIWVVADAEGYRSSLMERGSGGVGYEYRLVPIGLRKGVFHAKCCYLVGGDGDLLLVGSGNLTFGGFGRNLEVLEILSSQLHQSCFSTFADFLVGLQEREDVICPDYRWANSFADRAREVSTNGNESSRYPRVLTSLEHPIREQLVSEVTSCGQAEDLTILSPFFDPDARAVLDLGMETKVPEVRIALPIGSEPSSFPFPKVKRWPIKVSAVELAVRGDGRRLHAKWMEWKTASGILTMTGSINATNQALSQKNNIEIGVVRLAQSDAGWADWAKAAIPTSYQAQTFTRSGLGASYLVVAELQESGNLNGRIVSVASPAGSWVGTIERSDGSSVPFTVLVTNDGHFSRSHVTLDEAFLFASGLQIKLESEGRFARGWITNVTILNLPKTYSISPASLLRLINREETDEDDIALLDYLAIHAMDHLKIFQGRVAVTREISESVFGESDVISIDLKYLNPDDQMAAPNSVSHDPIITAGLALEHIFVQLRRRLLGHLSSKERLGPTFVVGSSFGRSEQDAERALPDPEDSSERFDSAFDYFMDSMEELAHASIMSNEHRRAILVIWVEVALHMLVRRRRDRAEASAFLYSWFRVATSLTSTIDEVDSLEQHIVTSSAILASIKSAEQSIELALHEGLERYWRGVVNPERAATGLLPHSRLSIAALFLESSHVGLEENLRHVLATTTLRTELENVLASGKLAHSDLPVFQSDAGRELRDELSARGVSRRIEFLKGDAFLCPHEFISLSEVCRAELQRDRVARCSVCGRLILRLSP